MKETEIGRVSADVKSDLYAKWKASLERYVMHLVRARNQKGADNYKNGEHLNQQVHKLANEVQICFSEWIKLISDPAQKERLSILYEQTSSSASEDEKRFINLVHTSDP
jgi:hypothetical protein